MYYNLEIQESVTEAHEGKVDTKPVIIKEIPQEIAQQQKEIEEVKIKNETESNTVVLESPTV